MTQRDKINLSEKIKRAIRKLVLYDGDQPTGHTGTGIVVMPSGLLLTAGHVVQPLKDVSKPRVIGYGVGDSPTIEYTPRLMDVSFSINMPDYAKPLPIDLAILEPIETLQDLEYVELASEIVPEGTEVLMAGFPDEITPPLNFDKMLNYENPEIKEKEKEIQFQMSMFMRFSMIKSGMVGAVQKIKINGDFVDPKGKEKEVVSVDGAVYWIDNASNHGASGGPVMDSEGKLLGIISEKGVTKQKLSGGGVIPAPAGSTMALAHQLITWHSSLKANL